MGLEGAPSPHAAVCTDHPDPHLLWWLTGDSNEAQTELPRGRQSKLGEGHKDKGMDQRSVWT